MAREMYLVHSKPEDLAPPPPPQQPKTPKGKWQNYWYHYKWQTIGAAFAVIVLLVTGIQFFTREKPDCVIIMATQYSLPSDVQKQMEKDLSRYCEDINHDGKVCVEVQSLAFPTDANSQAAMGGNQLALADSQKLVANLATDSVMLYVFDQPTYENRMKTLLEENSVSFFQQLTGNGQGLNDDKTQWNWKGSALQKEAIYQKTVPEDLMWGVRKTSETVKGKTAEKNQQVSRKLLESLMKNEPVKLEKN